MQQYPNLKHFAQGEWAVRRNWAPNPFLYNVDVSEQEARHIPRLLVGGQDLQAGWWEPRAETILENRAFQSFSFTR